MIEHLEATWKSKLVEECEKSYFTSLTQFVQSEYASKTIFPPYKLIFNAFDKCPFDQVKVVILGQDPYHGEGQAHGLCFSVCDGQKFPPSLRNIFKEIERDLNIAVPFSGNLSHWAEQGVLLLNATLTVQATKAGSHQKRGWEEFTDAVIEKISQEKEHVVFLFWGAYAQSKTDLIDKSKHLVLEAVHPSPLSAYRGFIGCGHFGMVNRYLEGKGVKPIKW